MQKKMGTKTFISFYEYPWMEKNPLKVMFPKHYLILNQHDKKDNGIVFGENGVLVWDP